MPKKMRLYLKKLHIDALLDCDYFTEVTSSKELFLLNLKLFFINLLINDKKYEEFKEVYLINEYDKIKGDNYFICKYSLDNHGSFFRVFREDEVESFRIRVTGLGSSFDGVICEATVDDVKNYIAINLDI